MSDTFSTDSAHPPVSESVETSSSRSHGHRSPEDNEGLPHANPNLDAAETSSNKSVGKGTPAAHDSGAPAPPRPPSSAWKKTQPKEVRRPPVSGKRAGSGAQFSALLKKTWAFQKRQRKTNLFQIIFPIFTIGTLLGTDWMIQNLLTPEDIEAIFGAAPGELIPGDPNPLPLSIVGLLPYGYHDPASTNYTSFNEQHCGGFLPYAGDAAFAPNADGIATDVDDLMSFAPQTNLSIICPTGDPLFPVHHPFADLSSMDEELLENANADLTGGTYYDISVIFEDVDLSGGSPKLQYSAGVNRTGYMENTFGLSGSSFFPTFSYINSAFLARVSGDTTAFFNSAVKGFPSEDQILEFDFVSFQQLESFLYQIHWQLPVIVGVLVYDRETGLVDMMELMGLRRSVYFAVMWFGGTLAVLISLLATAFFGAAVNLSFFLNNSIPVLLAFALAWSQAIVGYSFVFSVGFNKARSGVIWTYVLLFVLCIVSQLYELTVGEAIGSFGGGEVNPIVEALVSWIPSFSAARFIRTLSNATANGATGADLSTWNELGVMWPVIKMFISGVVFTVGASLYSSGALTQQSASTASKNASEEEEHLRAQTKIGAATPAGARTPDEVAEEEGDTINQNDPAVMRAYGLNRVFVNEQGADVTAVDAMTFHVKPLECFGLLGPNGAGKSTTMRVLSGIHQATGGGAFIAGYSVRGEIDAIRGIIGVCPQDDVLWGDMTPEEHIVFYARLRGMTGDAVAKEVQDALTRVDLWEDRSKLVKNFSGGMKRRLSVAIAFVGEPALVFLDEPTTGLDPRMRQQVWNIIHSVKASQAIILTTHSMEEAESLCDRICIMANGRMFTVGSSQELKDLFGAGYNLSISANPAKTDSAMALIKQVLPTAEPTSQFAGVVKYRVIPKAGEKFKLGEIFTQIEEGKAKAGIDDWGISATTLEDAFLRVSAEAAAEL